MLMLPTTLLQVTLGYESLLYIVADGSWQPAAFDAATVAQHCYSVQVPLAGNSFYHK